MPHTTWRAYDSGALSRHAPYIHSKKQAAVIVTFWGPFLTPSISLVARKATEVSKGKIWLFLSSSMAGCVVLPDNLCTVYSPRGTEPDDATAERVRPASSRPCVICDAASGSGTPLFSSSWLTWQ